MARGVALACIFPTSRGERDQHSQYIFKALCLFKDIRDDIDTPHIIPSQTQMKPSRRL